MAGSGGATSLSSRTTRRRWPPAPAPRRAARAARLRGHAGAAVRLHPEPPGCLRRLSTALPLLLRRSPGTAEGPALGAQLARRQRAHRPEELVRVARRSTSPRSAADAAQEHLGTRGLPRRRAGARVLPAGPRLAGGVRRRAGPGRRADRGGARGGGEDRGAGLQRPCRPDRLAARPAGARVGHRRLQDRPLRVGRRRRARFAGVGAVRVRGRAGVPPAVPPGRAAPSAERHRRRARAQCRVVGAAGDSRGGDRPRHHGRRAVGRRRC